MALRRKLPSRMTTDTPSESEATPMVSSQSTPKPTPVEAPVAAPVVTPVPQDDPFAAAAAEAFGTVEVAPKPRVLEESFSAPVMAAEPVAEPAAEPVVQPAAESFTAPAWQQPAETFTAPAWDAPAESTQPDIQPEPAFSAPAWEVPAAEPVVESAPAVVQPEAHSEPVFTASAWEQPVEELQPVAEPEAVSAPIVTDFMPQAETFAAPEAPTSVPEVAFDMPQAVSVAAPEQAETPAEEAADEAVQGPTHFSFEPSRPDGSRIKRRVREKRARDFSAMGASEDAKASRPQAVTDAFAPTVPVDTRPIDQVDDALIESGVMAPRPGDSLTSHLPSSVAESTMRFEPEPLPITPILPEPMPEPAPLSPVEAAPVNLPEPVGEVAPKPVEEPQPEPRMAPQPAPAEPFVAPAAPQPEADVRVPSFNLSNAPAPQAETPLPAPQSDLPWVQPQAAAEWDIGPSQGHEWAQHTPETASEPAMHMPPQADLYKSMPGRPASVPPQIPGGIPSPSASASLTPELPGQRRKAQGTPWALVAVGAVVVLAAGGYLLTSGKQGAGAQLANLTNRTATGNEQPPLLPPPDGSGTGSGSFMAAQPGQGTNPVGDPSSSAMVAFADVDPNVANQPIVAEGNEEMPKGFIAQFQNEVEKARNLKDSGASPAEASSGITSATTPPAAGTGYTQDDLKKELEAYRTALASSANPGELKPGSFDATRSGGQTDSEMASGSLLPPPSALPPAELYTNNPKNLPVVAEPVTNAPDRVRTLADFPEVDAYMPEREKVEIPANLKPKLAATDFPALEVLSYVPNQGVVAFADGREGVLLIGESINGWELVAVNADTAEFKAGQKSYQVTSQN